MHEEQYTIYEDPSVMTCTVCGKRLREEELIYTLRGICEECALEMQEDAQLKNSIEIGFKRR